MDGVRGTVPKRLEALNRKNTSEFTNRYYGECCKDPPKFDLGSPPSFRAGTALSKVSSDDRGGAFVPASGLDAATTPRPEIFRLLVRRAPKGLRLVR